MGGLGDEASHLADPHPTALTMPVNLTVRYTFQHGPTACSISLMDSGVQWAFYSVTQLDKLLLAKMAM